VTYGKARRRATSYLLNMSPRITLLVWSVFELVLGVAMFLIPGQTLGIVGIDEPAELWPIRAIGATVVALGIYYFAGTVADSRAFYRWTVFGRLVIAGGLAATVIIDGPWQLWLFTAAETASALWTFAALRPSPEPAAPDAAAPAAPLDDE